MEIADGDSAAARRVLNELALNGISEAYTTTYADIVGDTETLKVKFLIVRDEMAAAGAELNAVRQQYTDEAKLGNEELTAQVNELRDANKKLADEFINDVSPKAQVLLDTVGDLTVEWLNHYDAIMKVIEGYMQMIKAMEQALEIEAQNLDMSQDYSLLAWDAYASGDMAAMMQHLANRTKKINALGLTEDAYIFNNDDLMKVFKYIMTEQGADWFNNSMSRNWWNVKQAFDMDLDLRKRILGYATGGYTGEWNDRAGRLALLHQKELVLNQTDTENILKTVEMARKLSEVISLRSQALRYETLLSRLSDIFGSGTLEQNVTIHAEFPNATNHSEIEEAFDNLINRASQFAGRF